MKRAVLAGLALAFAAGFTPAGAADQPRPASAALVEKGAIDATLKRFVDEGRLVGVSALVLQDGQERYFGAYGMADREAGRPMARDTITQIFSMTKPVTGVALMMLYEEGRFKLDDPLAKYLPEFADVKVWAGQDASGSPVLEAPRRPITVRDITRHTAGFASEQWSPAGLSALYIQADVFNRANSLEEVGRRLAKLPLAFHPGEKWAYGPSVDVQALLVERLSGKPFAVFVQERILNPLGMKDTGYRVAPANRARLAAMYARADDGRFTRAPDAQALSMVVDGAALTPGGWGLTSTLDDYMRFARMLLNEGELDGVRLLKAETVRLMSTDQLPKNLEDKGFLPNKGEVGFGVDFAVRLAPPTFSNPEEGAGAVGEYFWDGAANTLFWVDPANRITAVLFTQYMPFGKTGLHQAFRGAVYGAGKTE